MSRFWLSGIALGLVLNLQALAGGTARAGETHQVEMRKFKFEPAELTVKAGDTVQWINKERRQYHTVWFRQAGDPETVELFPGDEYQKTFDQVGDYPYVCGPHEKDYDMMGIVRVK